MWHDVQYARGSASERASAAGDGSGSDRIQCGYSSVSVFQVSGLGLFFRPRFLSSGLGLVSGSVSGFGFYPWISNGYSK